MSLSRWVGGGDSYRMSDLNRDKGLDGHCKIPALQSAKLPRYRREGAVEVRPFPAETRPRVSMAQGLSGEAMKGNPTTTVIPRVDESKPSLRTWQNHRTFRPHLLCIRQIGEPLLGIEFSS